MGVACGKPDQASLRQPPGEVAQFPGRIAVPLRQQGQTGFPRAAHEIVEDKVKAVLGHAGIGIHAEHRGGRAFDDRHRRAVDPAFLQAAKVVDQMGKANLMPPHRAGRNACPCQGTGHRRPRTTGETGGLGQTQDVFLRDMLHRHSVCPGKAFGAA